MGTKSFEPRIARAAPAFRIVGVVLLVSGLVHLYLDRVVFTPRPFAARAARMIAQVQAHAPVAV